MIERESALAVVCSGAGNEPGAVHGYELGACGRVEAITTTQVADPSYLAVGPDRRHLYVVERIAGAPSLRFR